VDDEEDMVFVMRVRLRAMGYEVDTSYSGEKCLEYLKNQKPDLVLLDIMLPGLSGFDVCKEIKKDPSLKEIPVLMLTAKSGEQDIQKAKEAGAQDYLIKPFEADELSKKIKICLPA